MAETTKIEWTHATWNPWRGCQHATLPDGTPHPGCLSCYAEAGSKRNPAVLGQWGPQGTRVMAAPAYWRHPAKWNREAQAAGVRRRVFCASLADVFEDWQGPIMASMKSPTYIGKDRRSSRGLKNRMTMNDLRGDVFLVIDETQNLDWLILTKRPQNVHEMWPAVTGTEHYDPYPDSYRSNVWLLTSVSDQRTANALIPPLLECRDLVPVIGLSIEPFLGRVKLKGRGCQWCFGRGWMGLNGMPCSACFGIDWIIIGCESHGRRVGSLGEFRSESEWWSGAQEIVEQCRAAGVPCFMKQVPIKGRVSHDPAEWPEWARVREFPQTQEVRT